MCILMAIPHRKCLKTELHIMHVFTQVDLYKNRPTESE